MGAVRYTAVQYICDNVQFLDSLAADNDFAEVINIGKSYEGRDMNVLAVRKVGTSHTPVTGGQGLFTDILKFSKECANYRGDRDPGSLYLILLTI